MRQFVLVCFFWAVIQAVCPPSFAQSSKPKAKKEKAAKALPEKYSKDPLETKVDPWWLVQEAEALKTKNPSLALRKLEEALSHSIQSGNVSTEAHCYRVLGAINLQNNLLEAAIRQTQKAVQLFQDTKDARNELSCRFQLAECYYASQQYTLAFPLFSSYVLENGPKTLAARYRMAEIQAKLGNTEVAAALYENIMHEEKTRNNKEGEAEANRRIGELYQSKGSNKRALEYYKEAQEIAEQSNDAASYSNINDKISEVLIQDKKYKEEINLRKKSIEKSQETQNPAVEGKEHLAIANSYLQLHQAQLAIPYLVRSLEIASQLGNLEEQSQVLKSLSEAYSQKRQFEKATEMLKKHLAIKDTLIKKRELQLQRMNNSNLSLAEQQKRIDGLEKDIALNEQTIAAMSHEQVARDEKLNRQRTLIYSLAIGLVLIAAASYLIYLNARKRRIANQLLALKSLRSQMNPHFIFNALNSVNSFISKNDERSANKYLADFSRLMRMVMENSQHDFVPFSQELHILELYLALEHFRFLEKFDYRFTVEDGIEADSYEVPPMLIQPYIENAVWHGLRYKDTKGHLTVTVAKTGQAALSVTIEDDGIGRRRSAELKTANQKSTSSTGIKNTVNRIALINELYKKNIKITIEDLDPTALDSGTKVTIHLPKKA